MIENLEQYFLPEQEYYLHQITYKRLDNSENLKEHALNCTDSIEATANEEGVTLIVTRDLTFEPEEFFQMSVAFGANLKYVPEMKDKVKWLEINVAEEFKENGYFVTNNLMSRISLLIAQITSSFGQMPLVLPPNVTK